MELQEFLRLLKVERGPNASGEYTCRCPSHDDKTASLTVSEKVSDKYGISEFSCAVMATADVLHRPSVKRWVSRSVT